MLLTSRTLTSTIKNGFLHVVIPDVSAESGYRSHRLAVDKSFINRGVLPNNDAHNAEPFFVYKTNVNTINLPENANHIGILEAYDAETTELYYKTFTFGVFEIWGCKKFGIGFGDWSLVNGGVSVHSSLSGLSADDHPQYFNQTRGDARYAKVGDVVSDHGSLNGLNHDDHPQYLNQSRGDARYIIKGSSTTYPGSSISIPNNSAYYIQNSSGTSRRIVLVNSSNTVYLGGIDSGLGNTFIRRAGTNYIGLLSGYIYNYFPICINDSNTRIQEGAGNSIRHQTNSGYIDIGPQNTSYGHIYTNRGSFYFNKSIRASDFVLTSDRRFKKNLKPVENSLDKIIALNPIYFL